MPGNIIQINGVSEFYVGDSKMNDLLIFLRDHGHPENKEAKDILKQLRRWVRNGRIIKKRWVNPKIEMHY